MTETSQPAFCSHCGAALTPGASYCVACGAAVTPSTPVPTGASTPTPAVAPTGAPPKRRGCKIAAIFAIWAVLAVLVAGGSFAYGWLTGPPPPATFDLPSQEQTETFNGYGEPDSWTVAEGPTEPGAKTARIEQWFFYDAGKIIVFVNGVATDAQDYTPYDGVAPTSAYHPLDFGSDLSRSDVEEFLDEDGALVEGVSTVFDSYEAYSYQDARLLIGYLDGRFYSAQTF